jgi:acetylornithine deacetylase
LEKNGGPLKVERISYTPGRNNIIIKYLGSTNKFVSFVGSHMDVVTADPKDWTRDPFKFERDGDMLYGRGTTDCLGHVALLTDLFCQLAEKKPKLAVSVAAVFIANEENSEFPGIGVDGLEKEGRLEELKTGPVLWIDSADQQPCIGTGGVVVWRLTGMSNIGRSALLLLCSNISI